jgi:hypothetical protein
LRNVNYLVLQGGHDAQLPEFMGAREFNRAGFDDGKYRFKTELYIDRANHSEFNTEWGQDYKGPSGWLLNRKPLLAGGEQRRIAAVYISAFLDATLRGKREYIPMFRDHRAARAWLPEARYRNRFQDSTFRVICDYEGQPDLAAPGVPGVRIDGARLATWRVQRVPLRGDNRQNNAVYVGWETPGASYTIDLPKAMARDWKLSGESWLQFSLADAAADDGHEPIDLTVELISREGGSVALPLSRYSSIPRPIRVQFRKMAALTSEPILQTWSLPLRDFVEANRAFSPGALSAIRFRFDRSPKGTIILDDIGFSYNRHTP